MMPKNREWLQQFLRLDHRAEEDGIPLSDVRRQEDTVLRALEMLECQPGLVLADEVGMGKTFEALGVAAALKHEKPRTRIVILTPGPDLNNKWASEFSRFPYDFESKRRKVTTTTTLREFIGAVGKSAVTIAPVTMFQSGRAVQEQAYLLSLYCYWKGLHGNTLNAMLERYFDNLKCRAARVDVYEELFLNTFELHEIEAYLERAFKGLDTYFQHHGLNGFVNSRTIRRFLMVARSSIAGRLLPVVDLLIVDEAHKLKNPTSLRSEALRTIFNKRFLKAVFLTATPFQLDISELKEVFAVFGRAKGAPKNLLDEVSNLLIKIREYQTNYDEFQRTWVSLDPEFAEQFRIAYDGGPDIEIFDDPSGKILLDQICRLRMLKETEIEPGFRKWMIRSLRQEKREYRKHDPKSLPSASVGCLPFLIYERFIAELFRRNHRTHKAAAEINMVSSYAAAKSGAIIKNEDGLPDEAEVYRKLLKRLLSQFGTGAVGDHPKLRHVLFDALDAAARGEKTLIFCSRIETLRQLRRELDTEWESRILDKWIDVYPDETAEGVFGDRTGDTELKGRHTLLQSRFHRSQEALYLALREPYLRTVAPLADWALSHIDDVVFEANELLGTLRLGKTSATRIDYLVTKRCVEQAAARLWQRSRDPKEDVSPGIEQLCHEAYLEHGLDLVKDDLEAHIVGSEESNWIINERTASVVLGHQGSLWGRMSNRLDALDFEVRVRVVELLARYMTFKQVPFITDLLIEAKSNGIDVQSIGSDKMLNFLPSFWESKVGVIWTDQLKSFLTYFISRDREQQLNILDGPIRTGDFARHTEQGQNRERLREAFNTPLFPMVLVANEVMQEGLDLHKHCRRVVHHDLVWNPAQIEQRIGRIDRLGSLTSRMLELDPTAKLNVLYPVIEGTIDQRLYRTVKTREKWLEFLLGAPPDFSEYNFNEQELTPLPDRLAQELAIDLSPAQSDSP